MPVSKVIYGADTLIDLTADTVTAEHLEVGYTAHKADGQAVIGTLCSFTELEAIATDFTEGYVGSTNGWIYQASSKNRADIYQVTAGHTYFCRLVGTGGNRWRGCFTTGNPVTATANLSGSCVVYHNENTVPEKTCFAYKPRQDGYITIVKSNAAVNGIATKMYDITGFTQLLG